MTADVSAKELENREKFVIGHKKTVQGIVVSGKMKKTIIVKVDRTVKHPRYPKYVTISDRYQVHDESNDAKIGDRVEIVESRPISRHKRWALRKILMRASIAA